MFFSEQIINSDCFLSICSTSHYGGATDTTSFLVCALLQVTSFLWLLRWNALWTGETGNQMRRYLTISFQQSLKTHLRYKPYKPVFIVK